VIAAGFQLAAKSLRGKHRAASLLTERAPGNRNFATGFRARDWNRLIISRFHFAAGELELIAKGELENSGIKGAYNITGAAAPNSRGHAAEVRVIERVEGFGTEL
jgi:hypothetical protein